MTRKLHLDLMALANEQRQAGRQDICQWIMKHIAQEQAASRRRRGEARMKVRLAKTGGPAWIPKRLVEEEDAGD